MGFMTVKYKAEWKPAPPKNREILLTSKPLPHSQGGVEAFIKKWGGPIDELIYMVQKLNYFINKTIFKELIHDIYYFLVFAGIYMMYPHDKDDKVKIEISKCGEKIN